MQKLERATMLANTWETSMRDATVRQRLEASNVPETIIRAIEAGAMRMQRERKQRLLEIDLTL